MLMLLLALAFFILMLSNTDQFTPHECADNTAFGANLITVLSSLSMNIDDYGFYNASAGQYPDIVYASALCRGDVQLSECRECVYNASVDLQKSCPYPNQATAYGYFCTVRYSNETMFGVKAYSPPFLAWDESTIITRGSEWFRQGLIQLLDSIKVEAVYGGTRRKVAAREFHRPWFSDHFSPGSVLSGPNSERL